MECQMDLTFYPADTQNCSVVLRSSAYPSDEMLLDWENATLEECGGQNFDFQIQNQNDTYKLEWFHGNEVRSFDQLTLDILVRRKFTYHLVQTFFPSAFFVIIMWLGIVLPQDLIEARIAISMTTLLTLTAMFSSIRSNTPNVSYVRAIDIWMVVCIFFVFLTLLEFMLLVWLQYIKKKLLRDKERREELVNVGKEVELKVLEIWKRKSSKHQTKLKKQRETAYRFTLLPEGVEKYAFVIFCVLFITFCVNFWTMLLVKSDYFNWDVDTNLNCKKSNYFRDYDKVRQILHKASLSNEMSSVKKPLKIGKRWSPKMQMFTEPRKKISFGFS